MEILSGMDNCGMRGALQHPPQAAPHLRRRPLSAWTVALRSKWTAMRKKGTAMAEALPIERRDRGEHITGAGNSVR